MKTKISESIKTLFKSDHRNYDGLSKFRIYLMRIIFLLTFAGVGKPAWTEIITHKGAWDPMLAVTFSFWAALSALMILGLRYPLKMLPLLLLQFFYKLIWLVAVAYPLWSARQLTGPAESLTRIFGTGVVLELLIIPWLYAVKNYIIRPNAPGAEKTTG